MRMDERATRSMFLSTPPTGGVEGGGPLDHGVPELGVIPSPQGLTLSGEVDAATWTTLSNALRDLVVQTEERPELVLDLSGVSFIDVRGTRMIVEASRGLGPSRRIVVRGAPWGLRRIAKALRLDRERGLVIEG